MTIVEKMHDLIILEQKVGSISARLNAATNRLKAQQAKIERLTQQHVEMVDQVKHAQVRTSELEKQSNEIEERISRQREKMNTANNNKEYSALLIEINTLKDDRSKTEDEALVHMEQVDSLQDDLKELASRVKEQTKLVELADAEVQACQAEVGQQFDELTRQRDAAAEELPGDMRTVFRRLTQLHGGEAVASVVEENRRTLEYSCGGCYLSIPVEAVSTLMSNPDTLVTCTNCGRMLIIDQQLKTSIVK